MKARGIHRLLPVIIAAATLATTGESRADEHRIAALTPAGSEWMIILEQGAERLAKATDGRVTKKFYPSGVMGRETEVVSKMKLGQLDGAVLTMVGLSAIYPGIRVLELPFLFRTEEEVDYVRRKMWPYFRKQFKARGFHLMGPGGAGWSYIYSNRKIRSLDDLRKTKMWVWSGNDVMAGLFDKLGLKAVPMGIANLTGALKSGRVDACYSAPVGAVAFQWFNDFKYATTMPVAYIIGTTILRQEVWDAMSAEDRKQHRKIDRKMARILNRRVVRSNQRSLAAMKRGGVEIVETPDEVRATMEATAEKVWDAFADKAYSRKELDLVLQYRDEFRASQAKEAAPASAGAAAKPAAK